MTTGGIEVLRAGRVAVIESASETAHYPQLNRGVLSSLALPWLQLEYFDESEFGPLLREPLEDHFAAILFTPGALALPRVRSLLEEHATVFAQALAHGVGSSSLRQPSVAWIASTSRFFPRAARYPWSTPGFDR